MTDAENALGELLAAEAHYLRTRGWIPTVSKPLISWREGNAERKAPNYTQTAAVLHQRYIEENP